MVIKEILGVVLSVHELDEGYIFRLPDTPGMLNQLADFVFRERACCLFFGFAIVLDGEKTGPLLHITGPEGIKSFIDAEFSHALTKRLTIGGNPPNN